MKQALVMYSMKLLMILVIWVLISACQSTDRLTVVEKDSRQIQHKPEQSPSTAGGERKLTVVNKQARQSGEEVLVQHIHRLEASAIEEWLSEDEVKVSTTKLIEEGSSAEESQYAYTKEVITMSSGARREVTDEEEGLKAGEFFVKEQLSPDGSFRFIQKWRDKYTADNFIQDERTNEMIPVTGDNYMEFGGWLDHDTYVLAAGSTSGVGDIRLISTDGTYKKIAFEDEETPFFTQFGVSKGRIYYTDAKHVLKVFEPGQPRSIRLIENVWSFEISPDSNYIAVSTAKESDRSKGSELLIYDSAGNLQGSLIGKGDLISYISWAPDSSKLAFDVYSENKSGMNGVYIWSIISGKVSSLTPYYTPADDAAHPVYPLTWSPSGSKLGITTEDKESLIVTQVIDFK
ncbi:WD40 repeat domain-containing protein [Paenibacillus sp. Marseille-Q4541]|uniref:WD40 repeat domain-containing protein n=1 Tax=Paenibacillus sp. Marseille-Q4541 TaxID=2831522 RepID=UPI001BA884B7|nr:WD40 repeat domain-containing protein [Paenibacillus sp. Marseille-Q4541]